MLPLELDDTYGSLREVDAEDAARKQAIDELNAELGLDRESMGSSSPPPVDPRMLKKNVEDEA